jgi:glycosidase
MNMQGWFKDSIIYHILIDRFAGYDENKSWDTPDFMGGNLNGIIEKINYFHDLGINTIWLSPFYKTDKYHGYHVTDYFQVEPKFGNIESLKQLISSAHRKNIRIIADFVPNHCSNRHPFFIEARENRKSKYYKWFYFRRWPDKYLCFLQVRSLPKLNLHYADTSHHIIEAAKFWLEKGIDGFRLDHVVGPPVHFWKTFSREIKSSHKEAVLIGEAWLSGISYRDLRTLGLNNKIRKWIFDFRQEDIQKEYIGILDGVLDFSLRDRLVEYIAWKENPHDHLEQLVQTLESHFNQYPRDYFLPNFIDNHDMSRFIYECGQDIDKLKLALKIQFAQPHPPVIYYGTETGLSHQKPVIINKSYSDLEARHPMPWKNLNYEMIDYCKELIAERKVRRTNS